MTSSLPTPSTDTTPTTFNTRSIEPRSKSCLRKLGARSLVLFVHNGVYPSEQYCLRCCGSTRCGSARGRANPLQFALIGTCYFPDDPRMTRTRYQLPATAPVAPLPARGRAREERARKQPGRRMNTMSNQIAGRDFQACPGAITTRTRLRVQGDATGRENRIKVHGRSCRNAWLSASFRHDDLTQGR